jgi:hypothetical protein
MAARPKLHVLRLLGVIGQGYQNPIHHGPISKKIMKHTTIFLAVQC